MSIRLPVYGLFARWPLIKT